MCEETFVLKHLMVMIVALVFIRYYDYCYYFCPGVCGPDATLDLEEPVDMQNKN